MADRLYRAQVTIPMDGGIPEDNVVNTFHFDDDDDPVAGPEDTITWIHNKLTAFYQLIDGDFPTTVGPAATVKYYDLRDPSAPGAPRQPRDERGIALTTSGEAPLPSECAVAITWQCDVASGENPRRRRGRTYIGPLKASVGTTVNGQLRVSEQTRLNFASAAETLATPFEHPGSPGLHLNLAVYSPTTDATSSIDDAFNDVTHGYVDDAFDIQRRRGGKATTRTLWTV